MNELTLTNAANKSLNQDYLSNNGTNKALVPTGQVEVFSDFLPNNKDEGLMTTTELAEHFKVRRETIDSFIERYGICPDRTIANANGGGKPKKLYKLSDLALFPAETVWKLLKKEVLKFEGKTGYEVIGNSFVKLFGGQQLLNVHKNGVPQIENQNADYWKNKYREQFEKNAKKDELIAKLKADSQKWRNLKSMLNEGE
ncbi:MAG: hypothetical protein FWC26_04620 [Fibromonadales bacterium]|nr:hypothetical protein [Fibromonadales bacterium]